MARQNVGFDGVLKLGAWLTNRREMLVKIKNLTAQQVADLATKDIKLPISGNLVRRTIKSLNLDIPVVRPVQAGVTYHINQKVEVLRTALVELYAKCGEPCPQEIGALWGSYNGRD
jgi:hypothetical protein